MFDWILINPKSMYSSRIRYCFPTRLSFANLVECAYIYSVGERLATVGVGRREKIASAIRDRPVHAKKLPGSRCLPIQPTNADSLKRTSHRPAFEKFNISLLPMRDATSHPAAGIQRWPTIRAGRKVLLLKCTFID